MKRKNFKKPMISALEQRILFDGAAVATAVDVLDESSFSSNNNTQTTTNSNDVTQNNAENSVHEAQAVQGFERPRREVAFVDVTVSDYQTLVDGVGEGVEVYLVSSLDDINSILKSETNIDAIHILSHGNVGEITVGNDVLNQNTLNNFDTVLQTIKNSLSEDGDILLYGCNVASDGTGQEFIDTLASITEADIAASDNITGNSALGGDWVLEKNSGIIDSEHLNIESYSETLSPTKVTIWTPQLDYPINPNDWSAYYTDQVAPFFYGLKYFYEENGATVDTIPSGHLSSNTLDSTNLLFVMVPTEDFTANDVTYMSNFLNTGGRIVFYGENNGWIPDINNRLSNVISMLGGSFSIDNTDFRDDGTLGASYISSTSPLANGLTQIYYSAASVINYTGAVDIIVSAPTSNGTPAGFIVDQAVGNGRIMLMTDINIMESFLTKYSQASITPYSGNNTEPNQFSSIANYYAAYNAANPDNAYSYIDPTNAWGTANQINYWETTYPNADTEDLFLNLLTNSAANQQIVDGGGNPNAGFGGSPTVTVTASDVTIADDGATTYTVSVRYQGATGSAINESTIGINDITVKNSLGNALTITSATIASGLNTNDVVVNYTVTPPGGSWDNSDSGTYTVGIVNASVSDDAGKQTAGNLTAKTFEVSMVPVADITPPTFDITPATSNITATTLDLSVSLNEAGKIYYVVVPNGSTAPSIAQIKAGQDSTGASALKSGNSDVTTTPFTGTYNITGLSANTAYDIYVVGQDDEGTPNVMATATKVDVTTTTSVVNVNDAPVGTVSISGTVTQGQTLTASNNITDADGMGTVSYQWFANGVEISGATGSTYTLTQNEVNKVITVKASYTDGFGANESVTSSATTSVVNVNDAPVGTVTISGTVTQGQTLTASNNITDADGMGTVSYQWFANGVEISGATGSTYTLTQNEVNKVITVKASYTDGFGANESVTSSATTSVVNVNDAPVGTVTISGTVTQGQTLTASNNITDADGMGTISYQWYADGVLINGAVNSTYTLTQNEVNKAITVVASYTDGFGANESVTSSATTSVTNVNDAPEGTVSISGTVTQGQTLTASNNITDADGMGTISYQWYADGVLINGAVNSTYTLTQNEVNKAITVVASYTDGFGANESVTSSATTSVTNVNDAPEGTVSISGTVTQGQTLTASNNITDADGMGTISYQWYADGVLINGAVNSTYTLTQNEVNKAITVVASYTDGFGANESVTSSATTSVTNVNDAPEGTVSISGTVTQGQTLTASNNITDADGMGTISYQWYADGVLINGAVNSTYTLTQNEVNKAITVVASYTDGFGANETVTSSATTSVVNVNDAPVGTVSISGTVTQGQTLTASNNITDADGMGTISYQWYADGVEINGATNSTYTLTQNEVNKAITVVASYTDGFGANESVTSSATTSVTNVNDAPEGTVSISGTVTQGQTLTASNNITDADGMGTISYQWYADGVLINGAVNSTYTLTQNEVNKAITVVASYTDGFGANESVTSSATTSVVNVNDAPVGTVSISGTVTQGQTLTASNNITDADGMGTISYQWYADGVLINGAVNSTYTLTQNEVNKAITVVASYTDGFGANETVTSSATTSVVNVNHAPVGTVTISGTVTQGQTLTASNNITDADGMGTISYQWFANGVEISGATGSTYTLTQNEVNKAITVVASYTDGFGANESVTSSATTSVTNVNDAPEGTVSISGTVTQGQTLTASNNITDADGMGTISYQWYADGVLINGAVNSTYTLTQNEVNKAITVVASYTDGFGANETVTSSATASVVNVNHAPTVSNDNIDVKLSFGDAYQKDVSGLFSDIDFDNVFTYEAINLPLGLTMNSSTGVISGRANSSGEFKVIIKVTDNGTPALSVSRTYNMLVVAPPQVEISQNTSPKPSVDNTPIVNVNNITISTFTDTLSLGTINNNLGDTPADSVGNGYIDSNRENNNQENNNQPLQVNRTNSSNYIEANASLNVGFNGQISFDNTAQDSFSIVGIAIENMTIENNRLEIRVVDTNLAQNFIVTQIDGTALPTGLSFDPKTGNISGTIPENLDKLEITIKATNPDGTTRVLNLKLDLKELKKAQKNQVDADEKYMGLKEQIALENQKLDDYGSYLTRLFA